MDEKRMYKTTGATVHNIILENRQKLSISGVDDVESFDEETVTLYTSMGVLVIKGSEFKINKLNVETGDISIEGEIDNIFYSNSGRREKGESFLARMFK